MSTDSTERRAHPRHRVVLSVRVVDSGRCKSYRTRDLGLGGLFIETTDFRRPGAMLAMVLGDAGNELSLLGRVARVARDDDGNVCGLGVQFVQVDAQRAQRLRWIVERAAHPTAARAARPSRRQQFGLEAGFIPCVTRERPEELTGIQALVLSLINGQRTVAEIGELGRLEPGELWACLQQLQNVHAIGWSAPWPASSEGGARCEP